jgi:RimJ/RimL family protein N-acetyltransferase
MKFERLKEICYHQHLTKPVKGAQMAAISPLEMILKSGQTIAIRSLEEGDEVAFLDFLAQIPHDSNHTNQYVGKKLLTVDQVKARIEKNTPDPVTLDIAVFAGSKLIGFLNFRMPDPDHPWCQHLGRFGMMIRKEYWGQGIGRKLLSLFEPHAIECGISRVEAEVRSANERGVTLYKNSGYEIEGRRKRAVKIDGEWGDEFFIAKFLS